MPSSKPRSAAHARARAVPSAAAQRPQVTTIRLDAAVHEGLRLLKAHSGVKQPLNKWVNLALADFIEKQATTLEAELEQALTNIRAYRKRDPGYKRAIRAFIEAEVACAAEDPMQGTPEPQAAGQAVSMVRALLHG